MLLAVYLWHNVAQHNLARLNDQNSEGNDSCVNLQSDDWPVAKPCDECKIQLLVLLHVTIITTSTTNTCDECEIPHIKEGGGEKHEKDIGEVVDNSLHYYCYYYYYNYYYRR